MLYYNVSNETIRKKHHLEHVLRREYCLEHVFHGRKKFERGKKVFALFSCRSRLHALHAELIRQDGAVDRKKTNFPSVKN